MLETLIHRASTEKIIGGALEVHRALGPGLLESAYRTCLVHELRSSGMAIETEVPILVTFKGARVDAAYRADVVVDDTVVVEIKAVEKLLPVHEAQLLTYLKLSRKRVGLLLNFNVPRLSSGIRRLVR